MYIYRYTHTHTTHTHMLLPLYIAPFPEAFLSSLYLSYFAVDYFRVFHGEIMSTLITESFVSS